MKTTTEQTKEPITNVSEKTLTEHWGIKKEVSETVEEAAKKYLKKIDEENGTMWTEDDDEIVKHFVLFHKQQSDTLIKELVEALKIAKNVCTATYSSFNEWIEYHIIEETLSKANEYLNK